MTRELIVSVFGSSRPLEKDPEYAEARALGSALAKKGFAVCTGAYGGTMEAFAAGQKMRAEKHMGLPRNFFRRRKRMRGSTWKCG